QGAKGVGEYARTSGFCVPREIGQSVRPPVITLLQSPLRCFGRTSIEHPLGHCTEPSGHHLGIGLGRTHPAMMPACSPVLLHGRSWYGPVPGCREPGRTTSGTPVRRHDLLAPGVLASRGGRLLPGGALGVPQRDGVLDEGDERRLG